MIKSLLTQLVLEPRINALKWSTITEQTPNLKIGYPGQHLASLITGIKGQKTGARGDDLEDGSEVKSCSRIDQMDKCKDCKSPVARIEVNCSNCGSSNIDRKNDSKWLFTIRSEKDLIKDYLNIKYDDDLPEWIDEKTREVLLLRETTKGSTSKKPYSRSSIRRKRNKT